MPQQDTSKIKEKIIDILKIKGPSLPARMASEISQSILFTSAFLSELLSEKRIKISNMKIGNSPLYLIPGDEYKLQNFSQHLKDKEKESFELLKKEKFLEDKKQPPAIRVALRNLKDFAIPFKEQDEILWRYFTVPENEFKKEIEEKTPEKEPSTIKEEKPEPEKTEQKKQELNIFEEKEEKPKKQSKKKTKKSKKKTNDKFFNKVKEYLSSNSIEILDIESFNKNELILKIKQNNDEETMIAYNKKRLNENDIIKAHQKIHGEFRILCLGGPLKKTENFMNALKRLKKIEKMTGN